jgi:D-sedoheptulose 7-phosphate isomerase
MTDLNQNTDFLYPFIEGTEHDPDSLLLDLASSARGKAEVSARLQQASLEEYEDGAVVTALGNDVGFELIFSRQVIAHSRPVDIAIALSTSGNSDDLIRALAEAKRRGLLTIGFAGHEGGAMSTSDDVDHCFTVHSQSIHRIQESHARLGYRLWSVVQEETHRRTAALMAAGRSTAGGNR